MLSEQGLSGCRPGVVTSGSPRTRFFCGVGGEPCSLRLPDLSEAPGLAAPFGAAAACVVSCSFEGWPLGFLHEAEAGRRAGKGRPSSSRVSETQFREF